MIRLVQSGINWVESLLPPVGPRRNILFLSLLLNYTQSQDRVGDQAASKDLHGINSDNRFVQWMKTSYDEKTIEQLSFTTQLSNLACRVVAATAFYFTIDLSLYSTLTRFLSQSEKASKIALPILEKIASLPKPRFLQSIHLIIIAPVILQIIHMALIYMDPKNTSIVLKTLRIASDKTSQGLEFLWNLRFSLVCLGISETVFSTIFSTIYQTGVECCVTRSFIDKILLTLPSRLADSYKKRLAEDPSLFHHIKKIPTAPLFIAQLLKNDLAKDPSYVNRVLNFLAGDAMPSQGFGLGINEMWAILKAMTGKSNIAQLEVLFTFVDSLKLTDSLEEFLSAVKKSSLEISIALNDNKITPFQEQILNQLIGKKKQEALQVLTRSPGMLEELQESNVSDHFKTAFQPGAAKDKQNTFVTLLQLCGSVCKASSHEDIPSLLEQILELIGNYKEIDALRSEIFQKIYCLYPKNFDATNLSETKYRQSLLSIYGTKGLIHKFSTKDNFEDARLLSMQYHYRRFELNLEWYLKNQPNAREEREDLEIRLSVMMRDAELDKKYIQSSKGFKEWSTANASSKDVNLYVLKSPIFNFMKKEIPIPENFKFETNLFDAHCREISLPQEPVVVIPKPVTSPPFTLITD